MLQHHDLVAFVATTDFDRARAFYVDLLGLGALEQSPFALVLDAHGTTVRVTLVPGHTPAPFTVLGWRVPDIARLVDDLAGRGVEWMRVDGLDQDERGVWRAPGGDQVAWFADPDGNVLSLTQPA